MNRDRPITSLDHVHPLMVGLLELLPDVGEPWPSEDRRLWRHALDTFLDLLYGYDVDDLEQARRAILDAYRQPPRRSPDELATAFPAQPARAILDVDKPRPDPAARIRPAHNDPTYQTNGRARRRSSLWTDDEADLVLRCPLADTCNQPHDWTTNPQGLVVHLSLKHNLRGAATTIVENRSALLRTAIDLATGAVHPSDVEQADQDAATPPGSDAQAPRAAPQPLEPPTVDPAAAEPSAPPVAVVDHDRIARDVYPDVQPAVDELAGRRADPDDPADLSVRCDLTDDRDGGPCPFFGDAAQLDRHLRRRHRLYAGHTPQDVRDRVDKVNDLMREAGYRGDRYKPATQTG